MLQIYDKLLQFPLFQGMSHAELMQVVAHTKMDFTRYDAGKKIVREGDEVTHLLFLVSGEIEATTASDDHGYRVVEHISAPYILQPERLFGIRQRYTTSFRAEDDCHFITIDKQEVLLLLETQLVFRLNMLNLMATDAQRLSRQPWRSVATSLRTAMTRFFIFHTLRPAGHKTYYILMTRLAAELGCSRLEVSNELNAMQAEHLLSLHRGRIVIPLLERLLM